MTALLAIWAAGVVLNATWTGVMIWRHGFDPQWGMKGNLAVAAVFALLWPVWWVWIGAAVIRAAFERRWY